MSIQGKRALILVADDDPELVGIMFKRLQMVDCDVITASDGAEALKLIKERHPDLVILDVMMPRMNGWEVCKEIRHDKDVSSMGVIMLTGIGERLNKITSPLYGADDHLDKPFNFSELMFKIKRVLAGKKQLGDDPE